MRRNTRTPQPGRRSRRAPDPGKILPEPLTAIPPDVLAAMPRRPSHHFRVLRPGDLVVLDVLGFGLQSAADDGQLHLEPAEDDAYLEVRYTFQHLHEAAEPEPNGPSPFPPTPIPVPVRAANGSRLVYDVPDGEQIPYNVKGVLAAMSRLPLRVVPLATPRPGRRRFTPGAFADAHTSVVLPGGLRLLNSAEGLVLAPPARGAVSTPGRPRELLTNALALRTARHLLVSQRAVDLSGIARPGTALGPGGLTFEPPVVRPRRQRPRAPKPDETAIEAPFRLILSPSVLGGFTHAVKPRRVAPDPARAHDPERVELWHSRLGVRRVDEDGVVSVDETTDQQKIVRAVWTRDLDNPPPDLITFLASLTAEDREALVRESADPAYATPQPVSAEKLSLSSLGAWLELHGRWDDGPYIDTPHIVTRWDHQAASGRDFYVRVDQPYYVYPTGHQAVLVTITERKIKEVMNPQARLYQRKFLLFKDPLRTYTSRTWPFTQIRIRPLATPNLDFKLPPPTPPDVAGSVGSWGDDLFWPMVDGARYKFLLDCLDHEGRRVILRTPLLAVSATMNTGDERAAVEKAYRDDGDHVVPGDGQSVAMGPITVPGDTAYETVNLGFDGAAEQGTSTPTLADADIVVPAMQHLAPNADQVTVSYADAYAASGFAGANATAQVLLKLTTQAKIEFGNGTDRAGGFVQPDLPVDGLSRVLGIVGDVDSVVSPTTPGLDFDPDKFLANVTPMLFGLFELTDILAAAGLDKAPRFVTEQLDKIAALLADVDDLVPAVDRAVTRLQDDAANAATSALKTQAEQARAAIAALQSDLDSTVADLTAALDALMALDAPSDLPSVTAAVGGLLGDLSGFVASLDQSVRQLPMPAAAKADLERLTGALGPLLDVAAVADTLEAVADFVNGIDPASMTIRARYDWRPTMKNFPDVIDPAQALFFMPKDGFQLSVEARASGATGVGVDVLAELRDFGLNLFLDQTLLTIRFDRLAFRAASGRKPEVDVVFAGMEWKGVLGFIETLQRLIPFDGFSDPPYVDVSTDGVTAGFDLALPNVAVGVFSLENISLGADIRVPFLGDALTVGFNFCTREKPFRLTVMAIGGGGFVGLRLSPKGLVMLEMALEAGCSLSLDFGVASGSVSVMVGIYMKLEDDKGSLTGYFRIRGEVDVLGLISASITLELALTYDMDTGKMVGRASITVEVEVLFFSTSVKISCERRLAGSKGDPTLAQILGVPEDGTPLGAVPAAWTDYCAAFAGA